MLKVEGMRNVAFGYKYRESDRGEGGGDIQDWRSLTMTSHKKIHLDLNPLETM